MFSFNGNLNRCIDFAILRNYPCLSILSRSEGQWMRRGWAEATGAGCWWEEILGCPVQRVSRTCWWAGIPALSPSWTGPGGLLDESEPHLQSSHLENIKCFLRSSHFKIKQPNEQTWLRTSWSLCNNCREISTEKLRTGIWWRPEGQEMPARAC